MSPPEHITLRRRYPERQSASARWPAKPTPIRQHLRAAAAEHLRRARVDSSTAPGDSAVAPRATWTGYVKVAALAFPIALYAGATTAQRVSLHILNRKTGNRVHRPYIHAATGPPVGREHPGQ